MSVSILVCIASGYGNVELDVHILTGKRNDEEGAKEKLFTYASHVVVDSFKVRFLFSISWQTDLLI